MMKEKFPYRYTQMRDVVLPHLVNTLDDVNAQYSPQVNSLALLKNLATGEYVNKAYGSELGYAVIELAIELSDAVEDVNKIADSLYERLDGTITRCRFVYHFTVPHPPVRSVNASLSKRRQKSFLVQKDQPRQSIITFQDIASAENPEAILNQLVYEFIHYTWEQKHSALSGEPLKCTDIEACRKYAGLAHLWAKQNYLEIPSWVYKPLYVDDTFDQSQIRDGIPFEFAFHGLLRSEQEFVNV